MPIPVAMARSVTNAINRPAANIGAIIRAEAFRAGGEGVFGADNG